MILLWDIDGTLLDTGGSGVNSLTAAIHKHTGLKVDFLRESFSGLTDYEIVNKLISEAGGYNPNQCEVEEILETHINSFEIILKSNPAKQIDGVIDKLKEITLLSGIHQGILTGNCLAGANAKLTSAKLEKFFEESSIFTADFRNDSRVKIADYARSSLSSEEEIILIGDTPNDIFAARENGMGVISLPTGTFAYDQLQSLNEFGTLKKNWTALDLLEKIYSV